MLQTKTLGYFLSPTAGLVQAALVRLFAKAGLGERSQDERRGEAGLLG